MALSISLRSVARLLILAGLGLALLGIAAAGYGVLSGGGDLFGLGAAISLRYEHNVPAWFVTLLYFIAAGTMLGHARQSRQSGDDHRPWLLLSIAFLLLSIETGTGFIAVLLEAVVIAVSPQFVAGLLSKGLSGHLSLGMAATALGLAAIALAQGLCHLLAGVPSGLRKAIGLLALALLSAAPLQSWSGATRLWFWLGGGEDSVVLVHDLLAIAASSLEIAAAIAVVVALVAHARPDSGTEQAQGGVLKTAGLGIA